MPTTTSSGGGKTWAASVLDALGIAPNTTNVAALQMWAKSEGNLTGRGYNWLNTTLTEPGATSINSVGVKNYQNFTQGVQATAAALKLPAYSGVVRALATPGGSQPTATSKKLNRITLAKIYSAINSSPWCGKGCQTGHYPNVLWTYTNGKGATAGGTWPTSTITKGTPNPAAGKATCVLGIPVNLALIGGTICFLRKSQVKALKGTVFLVGGGIVGLIGLLSLASIMAGRRSPGLTQAAGLLPGPVGTAVKAATPSARQASRTKRSTANAREIEASTREKTARAKAATRDAADDAERAAGGAAGIRRSTTENRRVARANRPHIPRRGQPERRPPATRTIRV